MQLLDKGTKYSAPVPVYKDKVYTVGFRARKSKEQQSSYSMVAELDFEGCSHFDLIKLATKSVIISLQARFRTQFSESGNPLDKVGEWERKWNVKEEIVNVERAKATPFQRAATALGQLSDEEKAELLKLLKQ